MVYIESKALDLNYSLTLLTTLASAVPFVVDLRWQSNNQWDFLNFLCVCIEDGHLCPGDVLVLDNASVHVGKETQELALQLLESNGIQLLYLPTYSPELNPCELVFGLVKNLLRNFQTDSVLWKELLAALLTVSRDTLASFYARCLSWPAESASRHLYK